MERCLTRGQGAGGSATNKSGLPYEKLTDLSSEYSVIDSYRYCKIVKFNSYPDVLIKLSTQSNLFKSMDHVLNKDINKAHGCKNPDECYINESSKTMFILEKKFQQVGGSVCEKIQTPSFKLWQYKRTFPDYKIVYIYCLSSWFKQNCKAEVEYLKEHEIPVFWGDDTEYKSKIVDFIINY